MLTFFAGGLSAALLYVAAILICSGLRLYRVERMWTLLEERGALNRSSLPPARLSGKSDGVKG